MLTPPHREVQVKLHEQSNSSLPNALCLPPLAVETDGCSRARASYLCVKDQVPIDRQLCILDKQVLYFYSVWWRLVALW